MKRKAKKTQAIVPTKPVYLYHDAVTKSWKTTDIPKILICIPVLAWTHEAATSFLEFWTDLMTHQNPSRRFHVGYRFTFRKQVDMAENEFAQFAYDSGCTHVLLMDDDIYGVKATDLFQLLDANKDVIGGIMHTSGFPHAMCAFRRYDTNTTVASQPIQEGPARLYEVPPEQRIGIQKVDLIPFAFTLIKTKVFDKIPKPWFKGNEQAPTDSWFADSVLNAKLEYFAHFGVWLSHRGITRDNVHIHIQLGMHEQQKKQGSQIIMLTPDEMKKHEIMMTAKLKDAEAKSKVEALDKQRFFNKEHGEMGKLISKP